MGRIRVLIRIPLILICTAGCYLLLMGGKLLGFIAFKKQARRLEKEALGVWGKSVCKVIGMNIEMDGEIPGEPCFFVCNHLSYTDVFLISAALKCRFIVKSEVGQWPVFGFLARTAGMLFINRSRRRDVARVNGEIEDTLAHEFSVAVFPEATTSPGYAVIPFKSSLLAGPARNRQPVYFGALSYRIPDSQNSVNDTIVWWDDTGFVPHFLHLLQLKSFVGKLVVSADPVTSGNRKELALRLHSGVEKLYEPVITEEEFRHLHGE